MGSDERRLNVSLIVRDKVTRQCPQTTTFEEKGESERNRTEVPLLTSLTNALPPGQTGCEGLFGASEPDVTPNRPRLNVWPTLQASASVNLSPKEEGCRKNQCMEFASGHASNEIILN